MLTLPNQAGAAENGDPVCTMRTMNLTHVHRGCSAQSVFSLTVVKLPRPGRRSGQWRFAVEDVSVSARKKALKASVVLGVR